jgi:hypothetical protein
MTLIKVELLTIKNSQLPFSVKTPQVEAQLRVVLPAITQKISLRD